MFLLWAAAARKLSDLRGASCLYFLENPNPNDHQHPVKGFVSLSCALGNSKNEQALDFVKCSVKGARR